MGFWDAFKIKVEQGEGAGDDAAQLSDEEMAEIVGKDAPTKKPATGTGARPAPPGLAPLTPAPRPPPARTGPALVVDRVPTFPEIYLPLADLLIQRAEETADRGAVRTARSLQLLLVSALRTLEGSAARAEPSA